MPRPANLSLELLRTFLLLVRNGGDAARTTQQLKINQPSMSKRLKYLQHAGRVLRQPWLCLEGKTWKLTGEGKRVLPAVEEIIDRYEQLRHFQEGLQGARSDLRFACGPEEAAGLVHDAFHRFRGQDPEARVRISTLPGRARIEGVANGSLDLATVTHDDDAIARIARRKLHIDRLGAEPLALVCAAGSPWAARLRKQPKTAAAPQALVGVPLILPAPDSGIRRRLERVFRKKDLTRELDVVLELSGWSSILAYVRDGVGVGLVGAAAVTESEALVVRGLDREVFPPIQTRLICRYDLGTGSALDLSDEGQAFRSALREAAERRGG
jgi:DNA-binding transcriptional LysR family regulator